MENGHRARMRYGEIPFVARPVSRLVLGVLDQTSETEIELLLDTFFEVGGNALDTAWIYGQGAHERIIGRWLERSGVREDAIVISKGAHTPHCTPEGVTTQLHESLERLRTPYVDLYLMHRDNLDVPVGEFLSVLNEHQAAGRIRSFGVSNWTLGRVTSANAYAEAHGLNSVSALSDQLSLARMVKPLFPGCTSVGDRQSRTWLQDRQLPVLAFSSQARGFFARADDRLVERLRLARAARLLRRRAFNAVGRPQQAGWEHDELVRCWYSRDNFARLERARRLAAEHGVETTAIAAAYVLCQPFPTFALIGPRDVKELSPSVAALDLDLTDSEVEWLNLESPRR